MTGAGGKADDAEAAPVEGIADLHTHMFAEHAFGGAWLHGTHDGNPQDALHDCDGGVDHARLRDDIRPMFRPPSCEGMSLTELAFRVPLVAGMLLIGSEGVSNQLGKLPGTKGDTGNHDDRTGGYPDFRGWPRWDTIAHQQVWEGQLHESWSEGLRLQVISAVSMEWLCKALPEENRDRPQCDEFEDVMVQLEAANAFAERVDWAEIALSPEHARRIISDGKLALILSVESEHVMENFEDWREPFEAFYDQGVRTLQLVHSLDTRFAGTAVHNPIFQIAQYYYNCHVDTDCGATSSGITLGFDVDEECKNTVGLKPDGVELVEEMIDRGMLIDAAHLSERSLEDLFSLVSEQHAYYPFYISHGHFREIMLPEKAEEEKTTPAWAIDMIRQTGGMFGLRTAAEAVNDFVDSPVANTCDGSSRSFAQAYDYGRLALGVDMGLGADFNGFIAQTRPRFGPDACSAAPWAFRSCQAENELENSAPPLGSDLDDLGLAHQGVLVDLVDDLDQLGTDTSPLRNSAEAFIRMWERANKARSGPAVEPLDLSTLEGKVEVRPGPGVLDLIRCE